MLFYYQSLLFNTCPSQSSQLVMERGNVGLEAEIFVKNDHHWGLGSSAKEDGCNRSVFWRTHRYADRCLKDEEKWIMGNS